MKVLNKLQMKDFTTDNFNHHLFPIKIVWKTIKW